MLAFGDSITYGDSASDRLATAYVPLLAAALGVGATNYAVEGVSMLSSPTGILIQILGVAVPTRYETCVMIAGVNDMNVYGTDATNLAAFKAGLQTGLLYLTSHRRVPEPKTDRERLLVRSGQRLPSVSDGCSVYVGTTTKQVVGSYVGSASPAAQALYAAAVADVVASVAALGRRVHLADTASAYDPNTMGNSPPSQIHPGDSGHLAIKAAFLAAIRGAS